MKVSLVWIDKGASRVGSISLLCSNFRDGEKPPVVFQNLTFASTEIHYSEKVRPINYLIDRSALNCRGPLWRQARWQEDGVLTVRFKAGGVSEMRWRLVTWGDSVKVVKPANLCRRSAAACEGLADHQRSRESEGKPAITDFAENLPFLPGLIYNLGMENELDAKEAPAMQTDMPNLSYRTIGAIAITLTGYLAVTGAGGWMLYQSAIAHMNTTAEVIVERITERLEPKIDANGERIDELSGRVDQLSEQVARNSVLTAQNGERISRNAELISRNAELISRNAELINGNGELITQLRERMAAVEIRVGALGDIIRYFHPAADLQQGDP